ncbi:FAD binding domain-containing protein [Xylariales sp. PMI_506]|nr:FAD binding domain-containing protein [Xylariales sp. PMI_506]
MFRFRASRHILLIVLPVLALLVLSYSRRDNLDTIVEMQTSTQPQVIVVGAGLAGLTAAYSALQAGAASVRLLERAAKHGGNSIKASSGINGAPTRFQKGGPDTTFYSDTVRSAGKRFSAASAPEQGKRESLIATLTKQSAGAVHFLVDDVGVDLSVVAQLGGHSFARTHRGGGKLTPGFAIVSGLLEKLKTYEERFKLMTECEVTRLISEPSAESGFKKVTGVEYTKDGSTHSLLGPVVFATGGFGGDTHGMLASYRPDLAGYPSTNDARPGAHKLLTDAGARLVDMTAVQIHPTGFVDPGAVDATVKFLAAEMLRGEGGILLHAGNRFVNELETREHVSNVITTQLPPTTGETLKQWDVQILLDPGACAASAGHVGFYLWKNLLRKVKVRDLDATTRATLAEYARVVRGEASDAFGRTVFGHWTLAPELEEDDEVCVGRVTPIVHFTMGGAVFDKQARVLASELGGNGSEEADSQPIVEGLWAAGEVTGGIHGDNRLGGSSLLECVVFGRIAGTQAAQAIVS